MNGGQLGDIFNTQFVLFTNGGYYAAEILFKGKKECDPALLARVRKLLLGSLGPK